MKEVEIVEGWGMVVEKLKIASLKQHKQSCPFPTILNQLERPSATN